MKMFRSLFFLISFVSTVSTQIKATIADEIRQKNLSIIEHVASFLIKPQSNNFVARPWAGSLMGDYKEVAQLSQIGEAFEISAYPIQKDKEAGEHPSIITFQDGSSMPLLELFEHAGFAILGQAFANKYDNTIPLLPKTLDLGQLLSFQAHPKGAIETYIIIKAHPGATMRVGFKSDFDAQALKKAAAHGRALQEKMLAFINPKADQAELYNVIRVHFANRNALIEKLIDSLKPYLMTHINTASLSELLSDLKDIYWFMLDQLNEIPVKAGDVIHNANPERFLNDERQIASAEVHALGNENGKEVLALEIRRPAATYRIWDNVRFPLRQIDIDAALDVLNFQKTQVLDFVVKPQELEPGVELLVGTHAYTVERLTPRPHQSIMQHTFGTPHMLFVLEGEVSFTGIDGSLLGTLKRGESGIMPVKIEKYSVKTDSPKALVIKVWLSLI